MDFSADLLTDSFMDLPKDRFMDADIGLLNDSSIDSSIDLPPDLLTDLTYLFHPFRVWRIGP